MYYVKDELQSESNRYHIPKEKSRRKNFLIASIYITLENIKDRFGLCYVFNIKKDINNWQKLYPILPTNFQMESTEFKYKLVDRIFFISIEVKPEETNKLKEILLSNHRTGEEFIIGLMISNGDYIGLSKILDSKYHRCSKSWSDLSRFILSYRLTKTEKSGWIQSPSFNGRMGDKLIERLVIEIDLDEFFHYRDYIYHLAYMFLEQKDKTVKVGTRWRNRLTTFLSDQKFRAKRSWLNYKIYEFWKEIADDYHQQKLSTSSVIFESQQEKIIVDSAYDIHSILALTIRNSFLNNRIPNNYEIIKAASITGKIYDDIVLTNIKTNEPLNVKSTLNQRIQKGILNGKINDFDITNENIFNGKAAAIGFRGHLLSFSNHKQFYDNPIIRFLGLKPEELENMDLEYVFSQGILEESKLPLSHTFGVDLVIFDKKTEMIVAAIQLKGRSSRDTHTRPNASFYQILELQSYERAGIKTAFINIIENEKRVEYQWLVSNLNKTNYIEHNNNLKLSFYHLKDAIAAGIIDPQIPRVGRKSSLIKTVYNNILEKNLDKNIDYSKNNLAETFLETYLIAERKIREYMNNFKDNGILKRRKLAKAFFKSEEFMNLIEEIKHKVELGFIISFSDFLYNWKKKLYLLWNKEIFEYLFL